MSPPTFPAPQWLYITIFNPNLQVPGPRFSGLWSSNEFLEAFGPQETHGEDQADFGAAVPPGLCSALALLGAWTAGHKLYHPWYQLMWSTHVKPIRKQNKCPDFTIFGFSYITNGFLFLGFIFSRHSLGTFYQSPCEVPISEPHWQTDRPFALKACGLKLIE